MRRRPEDPSAKRPRIEHVRVSFGNPKGRSLLSSMATPLKQKQKKEEGAVPPPRRTSLPSPPPPAPPTEPAAAAALLPSPPPLLRPARPLQQQMQQMQQMQPAWMKPLEKMQDVIGNAKGIDKIKDWLRRRFERREGGGAGLVIVAPPGVGSSSIVRLCAASVGADVSHIRAVSFRSLHRATIAAVKEARSGFSYQLSKLAAGETARSASRSRRFVVVLDHADALFSVSDVRSAVEERSSDREKEGEEAVEPEDDLTFQKWAAHRNVRRQAPIVIVVSSTESRAVRSLIASPGWDKIQLFPLTVAMTAVVAQKMCARLTYPETQEIGRACAGDARQVAYRIAFPVIRPDVSADSFVCQQISGNMFQACNFLLTNGRSVGRASLGSSSQERLVAIGANPRVSDFTQANFVRMVAAMDPIPPERALAAVARVGEEFSNLDSRRGAAQKLLCAEMVATCSSWLHKDPAAAAAAAGFYPEYHEREMTTHRPDEFDRPDRRHLLDVDDDRDKLTFRRRSRFEFLDHLAANRETVREFYATVSERDTRTITCEHKQLADRMIDSWSDYRFI